MQFSTVENAISIGYLLIAMPMIQERYHPRAKSLIFIGMGKENS
jgi:hypothetical protein